MDDDNRRRLLDIGGLGEIARRLGIADRKRHHLGVKPRIVLGDDRRLGVIVLQRGKQRSSGSRAAGQHGEVFEKIAPLHVAMGIAVVKIDEFLVHDCLRVSLRCHRLK